MREELKSPTNWPNPDRPGVPMFPERDGAHVIDVDPEGPKNELVYYWKAEHQVWVEYEYQNADDALEEYDLIGWAYVGPVITPAQIAEMLAGERERCAAVLDRLKNEESEMYDTGLMTTRAEITIRAFISGAEEIRNLGDAP